MLLSSVLDNGTSLGCGHPEVKRLRLAGDGGVGGGGGGDEVGDGMGGGGGGEVGDGKEGYEGPGNEDEREEVAPGEMSDKDEDSESSEDIPWR